jgi:hypothetical protein
MWSPRVADKSFHASWPVSKPGAFPQVSVGPPGFEPGTYGLKACMFDALDVLPAPIAREDARNALKCTEGS